MAVRLGRTRTKKRSCDGKLRFPTEEKAKRRSAALVRQGAAEDAVSAYPCKHCCGWHVGHVSPWQRGKRR